MIKFAGCELVREAFGEKKRSVQTMAAVACHRQEGAYPFGLWRRLFVRLVQRTKRAVCEGQDSLFVLDVQGQVVRPPVPFGHEKESVRSATDGRGLRENDHIVGHISGCAGCLAEFVKDGRLFTPIAIAAG